MKINHISDIERIRELALDDAPNAQIVAATAEVNS